MAEVPATSSRQRWTLALVCTAAFMLLLDIAFDAAGGQKHGHRCHGRRHRQLEVNAAMRPSGVVVLEVPGQNMPQMLAALLRRPPG
jgi:hypothetical protein